MTHREQAPTALHTITVSARGHILETASFTSALEAHNYKRGVRRWACERRVIISIQTARPALAVSPPAFAIAV